MLPRPFILALIIVSVALATFALVMALQNTQSRQPVRSFAECAAAGYPVMESYPRQCRTPDGQTFVEEVDEEPAPPDTSICVNRCGDGACAEIVCLGTGCPCAESSSSCPADCRAPGGY